MKNGWIYHDNPGQDEIDHMWHAAQKEPLSQKLIIIVDVIAVSFLFR